MSTVWKWVIGILVALVVIGVVGGLLIGRATAPATSPIAAPTLTAAQIAGVPQEVADNCAKTGAQAYTYQNVVYDCNNVRQALASATTEAAAAPTAEGAAAETAATQTVEAQAITVRCEDVQLPPNSTGQIFWSNHHEVVDGRNVDPYAVIYDPAQGGSPDHAALGWYHQPCLPPADERQPHEVAMVVIPSDYRVTAPECNIWVRPDKVDDREADKGLLIEHQNELTTTVQATLGTSPVEAWVFVRCRGGRASGFGLERLPNP